MGMSGWIKGRHMRDSVRGTLRITSASYPPAANAVYSNYRLEGVVTAPGLPPTAVTHRGMARLSKWPRPGEELPVTVDRADPARLRIEWDEVQDAADRGREQAEELAQRMRGGRMPATGSPGAGDGYTDPGGWAPGGAGLGVFGDPGRPVPGRPGGGTTPEQAQALAGQGELASAVVIAAHEVSVPPEMSPPGGLVDVTFEVTCRDGRTYTTRSRMGFSSEERRAMVATVGARVPVRVDPADQSRIAVDTVALGL
ncbi:MAG: hypothetical protein JOY82_11290 [Streptosporangiaceae bacterium]|nr:hypothetical protein [Streptosporangiaceae bacterium]MBV9855082.1 hypothetical protein [Streptosporangiaceae bacterium]